MSKFHTLQVTAIKRETRDAVTASFEVPVVLADTFRYTQGQHLTLRTEINEEDVRRSYSICSAVQDRTLRVAIKRVSGGLFSNWANDHLAPGMQIDVLPPEGHFNVPLAAENEKHYVAFAAGSGITPILSIIKTTLMTELKSRFSLFYGNRASSTVIFKEELENLKDSYIQRFSLIFVLSREQQDIELFNGRIDRVKVEALLKFWLDPKDIDTAFLCGPHGMIDDVSAALQGSGVAKDKIKIELFATGIPTTRRSVHVHKVPGQAHCEVTVVQDGRTRSFMLDKNKETLLDAALHQGIELPYSCKGGVCSTCRCKLTSGEVDMDANYALEDYEVARGFILACQSYPVTDKLAIDFDQET